MASDSLLDFPRLLTPREAAAMLRVSTGTLAQWRFHKRYNLPYTKIGAQIRYRESDVVAFIAQQVRGR